MRIVLQAQAGCEKLLAMKTNYALVTPKNTVSLFQCESDRAYFSKPVPVLPLYSTVIDRLLWVKDPQRGHTYPINPNNLKPCWSLTNSQKEAMV